MLDLSPSNVLVFTTVSKISNFKSIYFHSKIFYYIPFDNAGSNCFAFVLFILIKHDNFIEWHLESERKRRKEVHAKEETKKSRLPLLTSWDSGLNSRFNIGKAFI